jgi:hypothetical protein
VVFNDLDWVPGNHWQAEDRIYRIGQTRPAFITYLYAEDTLDDFVAALLEAKAPRYAASVGRSIPRVNASCTSPARASQASSTRSPCSTVWRVAPAPASRTAATAPTPNAWPGPACGKNRLSRA